MLNKEIFGENTYVSLVFLARQVAIVSLSKASFPALICLLFEITCSIRVIVSQLSTSAMTFITSTISNHILSATESSIEFLVISAKRPPMVS